MGALGDVAVNAAGNLWVSDSANPSRLLRIDAASGSVLQTVTLSTADFGSTYLYNLAGLQIVPAVGPTPLVSVFKLNGTDVPAGSLLVFNGYPNTDRVVALNPGTGAVIASLALDANYDLVGRTVRCGQRAPVRAAAVATRWSSWMRPPARRSPPCRCR